MINLFCRLVDHGELFTSHYSDEDKQGYIEVNDLEFVRKEEGIEIYKKSRSYFFFITRPHPMYNSFLLTRVAAFSGLRYPTTLWEHIYKAQDKTLEKCLKPELKRIANQN